MNVKSMLKNPLVSAVALFGAGLFSRPYLETAFGRLRAKLSPPDLPPPPPGQAATAPVKGDDESD